MRKWNTSRICDLRADSKHVQRDVSVWICLQKHTAFSSLCCNNSGINHMEMSHNKTVILQRATWMEREVGSWRIIRFWGEIRFLTGCSQFHLHILLHESICILWVVLTYGLGPINSVLGSNIDQDPDIQNPHSNLTSREDDGNKNRAIGQ